MKKAVLTVFTVFALAFFSGSAFAENSVAKIKVGFNLSGDTSVKEDNTGNSASEKAETGFSFAGEGFHKSNDVFKVGGGAEYLAKRSIKNTSGDTKFNFLPIYITAELSPIKPLRELYFKGNLGYNVLFDIETDNPFINAILSSLTKKGGIYYAFGTGYEFDFGLVLEAMYSHYSGGLEYSSPSVNIDFTYNTFTLNVGYKFSM